MTLPTAPGHLGDKEDRTTMGNMNHPLLGTAHLVSAACCSFPKLARHRPGRTHLLPRALLIVKCEDVSVTRFYTAKTGASDGHQQSLRFIPCKHNGYGKDKSAWRPLMGVLHSSSWRNLTREPGVGGRWLGDAGLCRRWPFAQLCPAVNNASCWWLSLL